MKLLFLNPLGQIGGAERVLLDMLALLRQARPSWEISLLVGQEGPLAEQAAALANQVVVVPFPAQLARLGDAAASGGGIASFRAIRLIGRALTNGAATRSYVRRLREAVGHIGPAVIHTNGFKMHVLGAWTRPAHAALVWHLHDYVSSRPLTSRLLKATRRQCAAVVANSNSVAADAARQLGADVPIYCVHNSVDLKRFSPDGPALDLDTLAGMPGAAAGTIRIGLVATFARWKGHITFFEALAKIPWANIRGYVVGGPLYETAGSQYTMAELKTAAARAGIASRVAFTGFVPDSAAAMRALDVVVHASTEPEPFGLAIAEAMATGRALVMSFAGGAAELVTPGVDALTHTGGDADGLAAAIASLAADEALRRQLSTAARQTALRRFNPSRVRDQLVRVYEELDRPAAA